MKILEVAGCGTIGRGDAMGPIPRTIFELSTELARLGQAVTVADAPSGAREAWPSGVRLAEFAGPIPPLGVAMTTWQYWLRETARYRRLRGAVSLPEFDIVHCHEWGTAWLLSKLSRAHVVYTSHGSNWAVEHARNPPPPLPAWRRLAGRRRVSEKDAIRSVTAAISTGRFLAAAVPDARIKYIPNGIRPRWKTMPSRGEARSALGIAEDAFVILTVARTTPAKGLETLISAARRLGERVTETWIIGSMTNGEAPDERPTAYAKQLFEQARGARVRFLGLLAHSCEEFRLRTAAADIFVLPSIWECQGIAALEAMHAGLPVVASAIGGLMDMVEGAGILVPRGDVEALVAAIGTLRDDPELRRRVGLACQARAEDYAWPDIARAHLDFFQELTG